jgi:hypothetical protein
MITLCEESYLTRVLSRLVSWYCKKNLPSSCGTLVYQNLKHGCFMCKKIGQGFNVELNLRTFTFYPLQIVYNIMMFG